MQMPVTNRPWKQKPPAEKWTVVGVVLGFLAGMALAFAVVDNKTTVMVVIAVGAVIGGVVGRVAYELVQRSRRSA